MFKQLWHRVDKIHAVDQPIYSPELPKIELKKVTETQISQMQTIIKKSKVAEQPVLERTRNVTPLKPLDRLKCDNSD